MLSQDMELQSALAAAVVPEWLRSLIRAVRREGLQAKDARVKSLWNLLRQRKLLARSPWLKATLRAIWIRGLPARPRPRTTRRLVRRLRAWEILPPRRLRRVATRPLRAVAARPVGARHLRPVQVKPVARPAVRK